MAQVLVEQPEPAVALAGTAHGTKRARWKCRPCGITCDTPSLLIDHFMDKHAELVEE